MEYPDGQWLPSDKGYGYQDYKKLHSETQNLLKQDEVTIYEAAFLHDNLFIRTDVLVKKGNKINLIEVKAKSFKSSDTDFPLGKKGGMVGDWRSYLFDVAFQKYVIQKCHPGIQIESYLMLADKDKQSTVEGLNQMFRVPADFNHRKEIIRTVDSIEDTGNLVLGRKDITDIVSRIENSEEGFRCFEDKTFEDSIKYLKELYLNGWYASYPVSYGSCKGCEYVADEKDKLSGKKSGFEYCFSKQKGWTNVEFVKPKTFDLWNFRKGGKMFKENDIYFIEELTSEIIGYDDQKVGYSDAWRHWVQIEKTNEKDDSIEVDIDGLKKEMESWTYPLHFIDFETCAMALPIHKGLRPYEQVAFQFSHHVVEEDGTIDHRTEYINTSKSHFPNFDFLRELKQALEPDEGSIFRYHNHENTILNNIYDQLNTSSEPDKNDLMEFIQHITHSTGDRVVKWKGDRDMIDLHKVVKHYYYNPWTKGSISLKDVLPAVLKKSEFLQKKYTQPLGEINLPSRNFEDDHIWIKGLTEDLINPYKNKSLPELFDGWDESDLEKVISELKDIADGGAALVAYSKLQYVDISDQERKEIITSLLKYCELDTLAMVMVYEHFNEDLLI